MGKRNEATKERFELKPKSRDPSYTRVHGNYPAKKYKKGTPVITRLSFEFGGSGTQYIDIAKALSIVNRKLYRQGLYYYVNSVEFYDNSNSFIDVLTLPDNWITRAAHRRGKAIFDEMNAHGTRTVGNVIPKYHDFKVYCDNQHRIQGSANPVLYQINQVATEMNADEWAYSQYVSADDDGDSTQEADNMYIHMIGGHNGSSDGSDWQSVGLIKSYAETRVRGNDSNPVIDSGLQADPLFNLLDFSSEEQVNDIVTRLNEDNDQAPYDNSNYVGELVRLTQVARLTTTAESGRVATAGGFCAPLGLVVIDPPTSGAGPTPSDGGMDSNNLYRVVLDIAVGTYNGVYAERM